jgi:hypothetical protein
MSNSDFILRLSDGTTVIDLTPSFDSEVSTEVIVSEARTKAGALFRYKWADFDRFKFDLERVPAIQAAQVNYWFRNNTSLSLSFGTALDIDAAFYFPFDESSGSLAWDQVNSYCLTFSGYNPTIVRGPYGGGYARDVASGYHGFSTTPISSLQTNGNFWASLNFKPSAVSSLQTIFSTMIYSTGSEGGGFNFCWYGQNTRFQCWVYDTNSHTANANFPQSSLSLGINYQILLAYRSQALNLWVQNISSGGVTYVGCVSTPINYTNPSSHTLTINAYSKNYTNGYPNYGTIDDLRFGFQTLTQNDIDFLASARVANLNLPIKRPVMLMGDKTPFSKFSYPYIDQFDGTLELEEI